MKKRIFTLFLLVCLALSSPALALTDEEADAALAEAAETALADCLQDDMTDLEKLTALHDWLAMHCDYGATLRSGTAYGAIVQGTAICTGYAAGYAYLASLAGLGGADTYSEKMDHAWILATLDGGRYFSDCTWDDGKYQRIGLIRHTYFLFDEVRDQQHYAWDSAESVPGGQLEEAPWQDAVTRVIFHGDHAYYIDGDFRLIRCHRATWETETLLQVTTRWPDADPDDQRVPEIYSGLVLVGERLYFATPYHILSTGLDGRDTHIVLAPDTSAARIYGLAVREGLLCYSMAESYDALAYDIIETNIQEA